MFLNNLNLVPFYSPDELVSTGTPELSRNDIIDVLNDDTPEVEDSGKSDKDIIEIPDEEEVKEQVEDEIDEEVKDNPDEQEEIEAEPEFKDDDVILATPRRAEILKKYPNIFKDFPTVEAAIYRDQQFSEIFPTIADARTASEDIQALRNFESDLMSGNIEGTLRAVKEQDSEAFSNLTNPENFLGTLQKIDNDAFLKTVGFSVKSVLFNTFTRAQKMGGGEGEQLALASQMLHQFIFGDDTVTPPVASAVARKEDKGKTEYEKKTEQLNQREFDRAVSTVTTGAERYLKGLMERSIDPRGMMSTYVKDKAINDALDLARKEVQGDKRFRAILNNHWRAAEKANFSPESLKTVQNTVIQANRSAFQSAIKRVRAEALKGNARKQLGAARSRDDRPVERGRPASTNNKNNRPNAPARGKSTLDYLMED